MSISHVARSAAEAAPVREDHQGEVLPVVEVVDRLRRLVRRVWEPNLQNDEPSTINQESTQHP